MARGYSTRLGHPRSSTATPSSRSWCRFMSRKKVPSTIRTRLPDVPPPEKNSPPKRSPSRPMFRDICRNSSAAITNPTVRSNCARSSSADISARGSRTAAISRLDSHRLKTARRSGAAYVRAGLCVGFLTARRGYGALARAAPCLTKRMMPASLDHADVGFTGRSAPTNGLLYSQDSPSAQGGRGPHPWPDLQARRPRWWPRWHRKGSIRERR